MLNSPYPFGKTILFGCLALLAILTFYELTPANLVFSNDAGVSFAVANSILHGEMPLLGPPSHLGGRHLGPIYYWGLAFEQWLAGGDPYKTVLIDSALKLLSVFFYLSFILRLLAGRAAWMAGSFFLLLLCSGQYLSIIRFTWHSSFLILPASFLFWSVARAFSFQRPSFWLPLLLACLTVQTHFASFPYIAGLLLVLLLSRKVRPLQSTWPNYLKGACLVVFLFAPALLYEFTYPSNFGTLLHEHARRESNAAGLPSSLALYSEFFRLSLSGANLFESMFGRGFWGAKLALVVCGAHLLVSFYRGSEEKIRQALQLIIIPLISYLPFLAVLEKPLFHFYLNSVAAFPAMLFALLAWHAATLLTLQYTRSILLEKITAGLYLALLSYVLVTAISLNAKNIGAYFIPSTASMQHAQEMADIIKGDLGPAPTPAKVFIRSPGKIRESAIYYFLGPPFYPLMQGARTLKEFPSFRALRGEKPALAYFISCPDADGSHAVEMGEQLAKHWERERELSLAGCSSCASCRLLRMRRKKG